jgi:hypothetical protein
MHALSRSVAVAVVVAFCLALGASPARAEPPTPGYVAAQAEVRTEGRQLTELVAAGNADELFDRFTPELARQFPKGALEEVLGQTLAAGPIGHRLGESALPVGRDRRLYSADHRWAGAVFATEFLFDSGGRVAGIGLRPREPLPPDPAAGYTLRAQLRLPVPGTWWVYWGGPDERRNYHAVTPDQRHAYDLVVWRRGGTHHGPGSRNSDYFAWDRRVVAPADGVVVEARDGVADNRPQVEGSNPQDPAGNHVIVDLGFGEYALLGHLRRGSVRVRDGERVRAGQPLGRVGNSGNSSEPHLHFHLQNQPRLSAGIGLPLSFRGLEVDGHPQARATPEQGQFIARLEGDAIPTSWSSSPATG